MHYFETNLSKLQCSSTD